MRAKYEGNADLNTRDVRWDPSLPGFGVRIYPPHAKTFNSRKTFVVCYRIEGRKRMMTIGRYGTWTLEQARKKARELLVDVGNNKDPLAKKQEGVKAEEFSDLAKQFMETRAEYKSVSEDQRRLDKFLLPIWRARKIKSITHQEVIKLHRQLGKHSIYEANRVVALISIMWGFAKSEGLLGRTDDNPAVGIKKFTEAKRKRFLREDEFTRLAIALNDSDDIYVTTIIWLLILTGARRSEWLTAKWEYIDFSERVMALPDTKNGEPFNVHLSQPAIRLLKKLPIESDNPYIFPGRGNIAGQGRHLINLDKYWQQIRTAANLEDVHLHDLRRTFASWMAQSGISLNVISQALNHSGIEITHQHYAHLTGSNALREPVDAHGARLIEIASRKPVELLGEAKSQ